MPEVWISIEPIHGDEIAVDMRDKRAIHVPIA